MEPLMLDFTDLYHSIQYQWSRNLRSIFYWRTPIARLIRQQATPSLWQFTLSYLESTDALQAYLKSLIQDSKQQSKFDNFMYVVSFLRDTECFHPEIIQRLGEYKNPNHLVFPLSILKTARILNQKNLDVVMVHPHMAVLARLIHNVNEATILTQQNFDILHQCINPSKLVLPIYLMLSARILTQENFNHLTAPENEKVLSEDAFQQFWNRINYSHLSSTIFLRLIAASQTEHPRDAFQLLTEQILHLRPQQDLNPEQSTHHRSVHRTASSSAQKLMALYAPHLALERTLERLISMITELAPSYKNHTAQRCLERILAPEYILTDEASGVSLRQLLGLAYLAIHDGSKRLSSLEDAKLALIDGLYEIQRGYNMNKHERDNGLEDSPICIAGAFNKIIEKLYSVHADVEINYISQAFASAKFLKIAQNQALIYLNAQMHPPTAETFSKICHLIEQLKQDGSLEPIWEIIKPSVQAELWGEFHEAYADDPNHPKLQELLNNSAYLPLPSLATIEAQLRPLDVSLSAHRDLLWSNRQLSTSAQRAFDQMFGLTIV